MLKSIREDESKGLTVEVVSKDPISPRNGRVWYNTSDGKLKIRIAGINRILAYTDEVPSGEVTWDDIIGPKPPVDATRNKSFIQPDEPLVGMKEADYWFKTGREPALGVGRPSFEVYQYDGTKWVKSCFSELGEMYGQIITDQIAPGTVLPEQLFVVDWYPSGLTWQNNTPSAGYVTWSDFKLTYNGISHDITTGNTNLEYIWWDLDNPTVLQASATLPSLAADDCLVAVNDGGTAFQILQATSLHGGSFLPETITETKIGPNAITSPKISANAVIAEKIAADSITSGKIATGAVLADKIAANAITSAKIQAGAVLADKLAANSVTTNKIVAGAVETDKLAEYSVIADKIAANAVVAGKIAAGAVVAEKLGIFDWVPSGLTWTDNSPSAGYVAWTAFSLCFEGTNHSISAGNTNLRYIWWDETTPTVLQTSATKPTLMAEDCLVCVNEEGTARQILQATLIHGGSILTSSVTADEIKAGTITADKINLVGIDANGKLKLGEIGSGDLDNIPEGTTYNRVLSTQIEAGKIKISSECVYTSGYDPSTKEEGISKGSTAPSSPDTDDLWLDTSVTPNVWKRWSGSAWVIATPEDLDDLPDGTTWGRVNKTDISAGHIKLSSAIEDATHRVTTDTEKSTWNDKPDTMDEIDEGTIYGRYLKSALQDSKALLSAAVGSLGDIDDDAAGGYGKVLVNDITSGHILLASTVGDLDDIADGTDYGRIDATYITAGHALFATGVEEEANKKFVTDNEKDGASKAYSWEKSGAVTYIDGNKIYTGTVTTDQIKLSSLTSDPGYSLCKIWYRSDVDQLRIWGTSTSEPFKIPRIPVASSVYITPSGVPTAQFDGQINALNTQYGPAEAGAEKTTGKSLTLLTNRTASNIAEEASKKWAVEAGANKTEYHTANNASNYTGNTIAKDYTQAKIVSPYLKASYPYNFYSVALETWYSTSTRDRVVTINGSTGTDWGHCKYDYYFQIREGVGGTIKDVNYVSGDMDEDNTTIIPWSFCALVPDGYYYRVHKTYGTGIDHEFIYRNYATLQIE